MPDNNINPAQQVQLNQQSINRNNNSDPDAVLHGQLTQTNNNGRAISSEQLQQLQQQVGLQPDLKGPPPDEAQLPKSPLP